MVIRVQRKEQSPTTSSILKRVTTVSKLDNKKKTIFLMLDIFFYPIYGLYFSHQHTYYILQSFTCWTSVGNFHVLYLYSTHSRQRVHCLNIYTYKPCPKQGLIHQRRVMLLMKQSLYPQDTTAGYQLYSLSVRFPIFLHLDNFW